jgi:3-hydroxybutyryl-CoA dehydratase
MSSRPRATHDVTPSDSPEVGTRASWSHTVTAEDVAAFAELSGDHNPIHLDDDFARSLGFESRIAHGALIGAYVSRVLGESLPGPGGVSMSYDLSFPHPVYIGDQIECAVEIVHVSLELRAAVLETEVRNQRGEQVLRGKVRSLLPPAAG